MKVVADSSFLIALAAGVVHVLPEFVGQGSIGMTPAIHEAALVNICEATELHL